MTNKMKITGSAPMIAVPTILYLIATLIISGIKNPLFDIIENDRTVIEILGVVLIIAGVIAVASCGRKLLRSFNKEKLMTDGLYQIFRDPMYASYLIFIIPGISLLFNSWLALTTIILNYILYLVFIRQEHKFLEDKFGDEYKNYLQKVFIKFL